MRTLVISDLHLGSSSRADVLRRRELRAPLLAALGDVERLVLLGDVLELRHGPVRNATLAARAFFEDLGEALAGREIVIVAGNHDHALVEPWLGRRGLAQEPPPLGLEQLLEPSDASPLADQLAHWARRARVRVAYPGLWLREDVYAMHGHFLDAHLTVPTLERLSIGVMARVLGKHARSFSQVADYEAVGAPVFAWRDAVAREAATNDALSGIATLAAWEALGGGRDSRGAGARRMQRTRSKLLRRARRWALAGAFPLAVAALNRVGVGPVRPEISGEELRRAGLEAMGEVAARLGLGESHVVFGHTHRAGPLPGDLESEWTGRAGARLVNAGSWCYASVFLTATPGESPYWPGGCVLVEDDAPPRVLRLLADRSLEEIRPARRAREPRPA